jgi:hypothetical protein
MPSKVLRFGQISEGESCFLSGANHCGSDLGLGGQRERGKGSEHVFNVYLLLQVAINCNSTSLGSKTQGNVDVSAFVLVTSVCSGYIVPLTKPKPSVCAKVEASTSRSSVISAAMQHANTPPAFIAA